MYDFQVEISMVPGLLPLGIMLQIPQLVENCCDTALDELCEDNVKGILDCFRPFKDLPEIKSTYKELGDIVADDFHLARALVLAL